MINCIIIARQHISEETLFGLPLIALLALGCADIVHVEERIDPVRIRPDVGFGYLYRPASRFAYHGDSEGNKSSSRLILLEDGKPLGPAHASWSDIRGQGKGRYLHEHGTEDADILGFSSSDNSDPRTNGRIYLIREISAHRPPRAAVETSVTSGKEPLTVRFSAPAGVGRKYYWDIAGLARADTRDTSYTFGSGGRYRVRLTVENRHGARATAEQIIDVAGSTRTFHAIARRSGQAFNIQVDGNSEPKVLSLTVANRGAAPVTAPRMVTDDGKDWASLKALLASVGAGSRLTSGRERAMAAYAFASNAIYNHPLPARKGEHQPLKILNSYGYGECSQYARLFTRLVSGLSGGKQNVRLYALNGHVVAEAHFDGAWHLFDANRGMIYLLPESGELAAHDDILAAPETHARLHAATCTGLGCQAEFLRAVYTAEDRAGDRVEPPRGGRELRLRPGEAMTWRWSGDKVDRVDVGLAYDVYPVPVFANGTLTYRPDRGAGPVHRITSPYLILAARAKGEGAALRVSRDGETWSAPIEHDEETIDLYPHLRAKSAAPRTPPLYEYYVKLGTGAAGLVFETDVQLAPWALPELRRGANTVRYLDDSTTREVAITYVWDEDSGVEVSRIVERSPPPGATGVSLEPTITARFSRPMDPRTLHENTVFLYSAHEHVPHREFPGGLVPYDADRQTLNFQPRRELKPNTTYTVLLLGSISDADGWNLGSTLRAPRGVWMADRPRYPGVNAMWQFTTAAD